MANTVGAHLECSNSEEIQKTCIKNETILMGSLCACSTVVNIDEEFHEQDVRRSLVPRHSVSIDNQAGNTHTGHKQFQNASKNSHIQTRNSFSSTNQKLPKRDYQINKKHDLKKPSLYQKSKSEPVKILCNNKKQTVSISYSRTSPPPLPSKLPPVVIRPLPPKPTSNLFRHTRLKSQIILKKSNLILLPFVINFFSSKNINNFFMVKLIFLLYWNQKNCGKFIKNDVETLIIL